MKIILVSMSNIMALISEMKVYTYLIYEYLSVRPGTIYIPGQTCDIRFVFLFCNSGRTYHDNRYNALDS